MAKGKQAVMAANRRLKAANEHIDRLTDELTEAKYRARVVEAEADKVPRLRQRIKDLEEDSVAQEAWAFAESFNKSLENYVKRLKAHYKAFVFLLKHIAQERGMSNYEVVEWAQRKFPGVFADGDYKIVRGSMRVDLSDEAVVSLQRARGERHHFDIARMWADIEEAEEAEFSSDEMVELIQSYAEPSGSTQ